MKPITIVLAMTLCCLPALGQSGSTAGDFSLVLSVANSDLENSCDIPLQITLTNTSERPIHVARIYATPDLAYRVHVLDASGNVVKRLVSTETDDTSPHSAYIQTLRPGGAIVDKINIAGLFDITEAGSYTIRMEREGLDTPEAVMANEVQITIRNAMQSTPCQRRIEGGSIHAE
jgi:hypothetical protein